MHPVMLIPALIAAPNVQETPPFVVATEYVRELGELWAIQREVDQEILDDKTSDDPANATLMTAIRHATRMKMALKADIAILSKMRITRKEHEQTLGFLIGFYQHKVDLNEKVIRNTTAFLSRRPGVDYGKLMAEAPQLTAEMEDIDRTLFQMTPLVFMSWIDMKPDSENHVNHLLLRTSQREALVKKIDSDFGAILETDRRFVVASASVLKVKLLEFKCSDEPWL